MPTLEASTHFMTTWDGTQLFYRAWVPQGAAGEVNRAVLLFHRGHEHSGRMDDLVQRLAVPGCAFFAWDARGNGQSPGRRDWAEDFSVYVKDADAFARHVSAEHGIALEDMAVVANSVGAVIASAWVHDFAPPIRAMVLATPAFRIKLYIPFAIPMLRLARKLGLLENVTSYVKANVLTHDPDQRDAFNTDEMITHGISTNILLGVHDAATRLIDDAGAIRVPTQMHVAGKDWVVKVSPQRTFFERLWAHDENECHDYPDFFHAIFHERGRELPIERASAFINRYFEEPAGEPSGGKSLVDADRAGFTRREYDRLRRPSSNPLWAINRLGLKTIARLSDGVRLGLRDGFDSGVTLDYVYRNEAGGTTPVGKMIDRSYLNSIGWRGIRKRREHVEAYLREAIALLKSQDMATHIVDVAAGPGRYILEVLKALDDASVTATLRDYREVNVKAGRALAEQMELSNATHEIGDAFDADQLAVLSPAPTLGIVSGLFELFPENAPVQACLSGLSRAIPEGGYLLYTNQPWHPQVEYIARVLPNREGEPWIMRRRTQEEMDTLVRDAGFEKLKMDIDPWGIFTVSLARRTE